MFLGLGCVVGWLVQIRIHCYSLGMQVLSVGVVGGLGLRHNITPSWVTLW